MRPIIARCAGVFLACGTLLTFAACGSDAGSDSGTTTSTTAGARSTTTVTAGLSTSSGSRPTTTSALSPSTSVVATSTVPSPSTTTPTTARAVPTCGGRRRLTDHLERFAIASSPIDDLEYAISDVFISGLRVDWGRGRVTPPTASGLDGFLAVARCEPKDGTNQWVVKDLGTSGVGCTPEVPADLAFDC